MKLKITQIKSSIGYNKKAKLTMSALGIKKINSSVVHADTPQVRGMIKSVYYLLKVEEV